MTDNILYATSRRVTRVHTSHQDGEPYSADVTHFFVSEDGWTEFIMEVGRTEGWSIEGDDDSPYIIKGDTSYGPIEIIYTQYTLYTKTNEEE